MVSSVLVENGPGERSWWHWMVSVAGGRLSCGASGAKVMSGVDGFPLACCAVLHWTTMDCRVGFLRSQMQGCPALVGKHADRYH